MRLGRISSTIKRVPLQQYVYHSSRVWTHRYVLSKRTQFCTCLSGSFNTHEPRQIWVRTESRRGCIIQRALTLSFKALCYNFFPCLGERPNMHWLWSKMALLHLRSLAFITRISARLKRAGSDFLPSRSRFVPRCLSRKSSSNWPGTYRRVRTRLEW